MDHSFPKVSKTDWLQKVVSDLKGKALDTLDFQIDGHTFSPFHHQEDGPSSYPPVPGMPTEHRMIGFRIPVNQQYAVANKVALDALTKGADLLIFEVASLENLGKKNRKTLLEGILTDIVTIIFAEQLYDGPASPLLLQEGDRFHFDALAGDLGSALFFASGSYAEEGAFEPVFHVRATEDYYRSLASIRALRLCWKQVSNAYGEQTNCRIIAHVDFPQGSDANQNKISATTQAMSMIIGGANGLVVAPSDHNADSAFTRRVALNLQHLLEHESYLHGIPDPAAGTYFLEKLTDALASDIWGTFQTMTKDPFYND